MRQWGRCRKMMRGTVRTMNKMLAMMMRTTRHYDHNHVAARALVSVWGSLREEIIWRRSRRRLSFLEISKIPKKYHYLYQVARYAGEFFDENRQCELVFGLGSLICSYMPPCKRLWCSTPEGEVIYILWWSVCLFVCNEKWALPPGSLL